VYKVFVFIPLKSVVLSRGFSPYFKSLDRRTSNIEGQNLYFKVLNANNCHQNDPAVQLAVWESKNSVRVDPEKTVMLLLSQLVGMTQLSD